MKYIKKVILENFQSHKNSVINFNNQLNVIVGPSDSGKTAILRGIKWALYNEPSGDYFIKEGETYSSVTLVFSDSTKIKRYRSKNDNCYYMYDRDNNETKFEGFGTNVPQEIIDITGINKILLDKDHSRSINLSDQLEGAFLLSESGATKANSIGRLVGANIIDESLRETLKDVRNLSGDKKYINNKVLELEEELSKYNYLKELKEKVDSLDETRDNIKQKKDNHIKCNNIYNNLQSILKDKKMLNKDLNKLKDIDKLTAIIKNISLNLDKHMKIKNFKNKFNSLHKDKINNSKIINSLENSNAAEKNFKNILLKSKSKNKLKKTQLNFKTNSLEIYKWEKTLNNLSETDQSFSLFETINKKNNKLKDLKTINNKKLNVNKRLNIGRKYLERFNYIKKASETYDDLEDKISLLIKLKPILRKQNINKKEIDDTVQILNKLKISFENDLNNYKELLLNQETCPFCFSHIDNNKIEHIMDHYK